MISRSRTKTRYGRDGGQALPRPAHPVNLAELRNVFEARIVAANRRIAAGRTRPSRIKR